MDQPSLKKTRHRPYTRMSAPPAEWRRIVIRTADVALHQFGEYASEFKAVERYGISVVYEAVFLREALLACMRKQKLYFAFMHPRPFPTSRSRL
jgi:hypothetical protein